MSHKNYTKKMLQMTKKKNFEQTARLTILQKPQLQSVSIFFTFVHPNRLLYLLCYLYLLLMF